MARVLILYHSFYGHIEAMAGALARGASSVPGTVVDLKRVPETVPSEVFRSAGGKVSQPADVAKPEELANYDAIVFGAPTRCGNVSAQMRTFIDQTGALWMKGALVGKMGSVFTSSATQHGGQESTILTFLPTLCTTAWLSLACPTPRLVKWASTRSKEVVRTERQPSPEARENACPASRRWAWRSSRASMLPPWPRSSCWAARPHDASGGAAGSP